MATVDKGDPTGGGGGGDSPAYVGTNTSKASPIGVPFYDIDPLTGEPRKSAANPEGRWTATTSKPTGVSNSFSTSGQLTHESNTYETKQVLPRYFDGAQWIPGSFPPSLMASLQKAMRTVGLLKANEGQLGVWDPTSMTAFTQLLAYANSSGQDWKDALKSWGMARKSDPNAGRTPLTTQVTSADDLRAVFRKTVINELGQGWDQSKIDRMVASYQDMERQSQTEAYNKQLTGGSVTAPPQPAAYAEAQTRAEDPTGVQAHDALGYETKFFDMLKGVV